MSKKRIPFATGGWVDTHSSGDMLFGGEMVITKDQQKRLSDIINQPMPTKNVVTIDPERVKATLAKSREAELTVTDKKYVPTADVVVMYEFLEDVIYCPTQIDFNFKDGDQIRCLYIRQRHGETTAQLVPILETGEFDYEADWPYIELSRDYDIEGGSYCSDEREEQEIIAIEKDCLARIRVMFPDTPFPEHPNRRRGRYGERLPDVTL
jgi:hypothetical protein